MPGSLKILFLSMEYPPETGWGGIGSYVAIIAPALVEIGNEVHVLSCVPGQKHSDTIDRGVHVHRRPQVAFRSLARLNWILRKPDFLARVRTGVSTYLGYRALDIHFDVIEYPEWSAEGWLLAVLSSKALVAHLHTSLPLIRRYNGLPMKMDQRLAAALERVSAVRADAVTAASRQLALATSRLGWVAENLVRVVPLPVAPVQDQQPPVARTEPLVLFLGRVEPRKAPDVLAAATSMIRKRLPLMELNSGSY